MAKTENGSTVKTKTSNPKKDAQNNLQAKIGLQVSERTDLTEKGTQKPEV